MALWTMPLYNSINTCVFLLAEEKCVSPVTALTDNYTLYMEASSKRGVNCSSLSSVYFRMALSNRSKKQLKKLLLTSTGIFIQL